MGIVAQYIEAKNRREALMDTERSKYLDDPTYAEKLLSHSQSLMLPEKERSKIATGANLAKIESKFPKGDPRANLGSTALALFNQVLPQTSRDTDPNEVLKTIQQGLASEQSDATNLYIQKAESGLFGRKDLAKPPNYEAWKQGFLKQNEPEFSTNLAASAAFGAGGAAAWQGIKGLLAKPGMVGATELTNLAGSGGKAFVGGVEGRVMTGLGEKVAKTGIGKFIVKKALQEGTVGIGTKIIGGLLGKTPAAGPWGVGLKIAGAALMAMPDFALFDLATYLTKKVAPEWSAQRPIQAELVGGVASMPAIGLLHKGLTKGFKALTESKAVLANAEQKLLTAPTAENMLRLGYAKESQGVAVDQSLIGYQRLLEQTPGYGEEFKGVWPKKSFAGTEGMTSGMMPGEGAIHMPGSTPSKALPLPKDLEGKILGPGFVTSDIIGKNVGDYQGIIKSLTEEGVAGGLTRTQASNTARETGQKMMGLELTNAASENPVANFREKIRSLGKEEVEGVFKDITENGKSLDHAVEDALWIKQTARRGTVGADKLETATFQVLRRAFGTGEEGAWPGVVKESLPALTTTLVKKVALVGEIAPARESLLTTLKTDVEVLSKPAKEIVVPKSEVSIIEPSGGDKILQESARRDEFNTSLDEIKAKIAEIKAPKPRLGKPVPVVAENRAWNEMKAAQETGATQEELRAIGTKWRDTFTNTPKDLSDEEFKTIYQSYDAKDRALLSKAYHQRSEALSIRETADAALEKVSPDLQPLARRLRLDIQRMTTKEYQALHPSKERVLSPEKAANKAEREKVLAMSEEEYAGWRKNNLMMTGLLATLATAGASVAVMDLVSPPAAEAGLVDRAAYAAIKETVKDRTVFRAIGDAIKYTDKGIGNFLEKMDAAGMLSPKISADGFRVESYQNSIVIPAGELAAEAIDRKKKLPFFLDKILGIYTQGQIFYRGARIGGQEQLSNPAVGIASAQTAYHNNTLASLKVFKNIMKEYGIKSEWKAVAKEMEPLAKEYQPIISEAAARYEKSKTLSQSISNAEKSLRKASGEEAEELKAFIAELKPKVKEHQDWLKGAESPIGEFKAAHEAKMQELATKHASVRVSLFMEDQGKGELYPWLKPLMKKEEIIASSRMTDMMEDYAARMMAVGQDPITYKGYVHYAAHPNVDYNAIQKTLEGMESGLTATPRLIKFYERAIGGKNMMPDIHYSMERYLPDANKRIAMGDFWGKGRENSWYAHSKSMVVQSNDGLKTFWDNMVKAFDPIETGKLADFANRYQMFEIARLLSLSPSVSFKHMIKLEANWSNFGWLESMRMMPQTFSFWAKKMLPESLRGKPSLEDAAVKAFIGQGTASRIIADMETFNPSSAWWDRMMMKVNTHGSILIDTVENFDRAHSLVAAGMMASKKGMTSAQAAYGIMDTMLKTNFLSGAMNPGWLRDPKVRLLFLFQGTPFKIAEQRAIQLWRGGKAVKEAGKQTYELLQMLKKDVKEGEYALKYQAIKDALNSEKDIWGTPITQQLARKMLILGGVTGAAHYGFQSEMFGHVVHMPFVAFNDKTISLRLNPALTSAYEAWQRKETDSETGLWFPADFMKTWIKDPFVQSNIIKVMRLTKDDIPAVYNDSRVRYLLGVPGVKEKD